MLLFGHKFVKSESFYHITAIDAITNTPPSSILYLSFSEKNLDIINHIQKNGIKFALSVANTTELIFASNLNATFIIVPKELAKEAQNLAETYLFDSKILVKIEADDEIESLAHQGIDGVLFPNAIIKINS